MESLLLTNLGLQLIKLSNSDQMLIIFSKLRKQKELLPILTKLVKMFMRLKMVFISTTMFLRLNLTPSNMRSRLLSLTDGHNILRDLGTMLLLPIRLKFSEKALRIGLILERLKISVKNFKLLEIFSIKLSTGLTFLLLCKTFFQDKLTPSSLDPRISKKNFPCSLDSLNEK